ncbi:MAG: hypothetical protein Q9191_008186, partial [Dirinaria sp. TL-2023a]
MTSVSKGIEFEVYKGSKNRQLVKSVTHHKALEDDEVLIKVSHSGLCGTDEHYLGTDMVLGHEGAGTVVALGPKVKDLNVFYGFEKFDIGSMASHIVFREAFVYRLPSGIDKEAACALMCGGATVFNIFDMFAVKPTERVGVVGVGGLGHLAIQFAAKWGCKITVFSTSESKRQDAMEMGATDFIVVTADTKTFEGISPIDHLIVATSAQIPWKLYLTAMAMPGTVYPLTVVGQNDELSLPYLKFLFGGVRVQASIVASRNTYKRMLDFAAFHGVRATVQRYKLNLEGIEKAMKELREGK